MFACKQQQIKQEALLIRPGLELFAAARLHEHLMPFSFPQQICHFRSSKHERERLFDGDGFSVGAPRHTERSRWGWGGEGDKKGHADCVMYQSDGVSASSEQRSLVHVKSSATLISLVDFRCLWSSEGFYTPPPPTHTLPSEKRNILIFVWSIKRVIVKVCLSWIIFMQDYVCECEAINYNPNDKIVS